MSSWINNLVNSINNIKKNLNLFHKLMNFEYNDNPYEKKTLYELQEEILNKENLLNSKTEELLNISRNMNKTPIITISRFSNQNLGEISLNNTLDLLGGVFNNELLVSKYNINIKKDIRIINVTKIYDSDNNILFNNKGLNLINFNTLSKVGRMDINKNFSENTISEDSYKTCVVGDIVCNIELSIPHENEENWKNEIQSLYSNNTDGYIIPRIKNFPKTHYNNTSINIKDKETTTLYSSGILNPYSKGGE